MPGGISWGWRGSLWLRSRRQHFVGKVESMKGRLARESRRARSHWWSRLLSMLVTLSLVVPPSQIYAAFDSAPGHAHAESGHGGDHHGGHSDHDDHGYAAEAADTYHDASRLTLAPAELPHACCSSSSLSPLIAAAPARISSLDDKLAPVAYAPAVLPRSLDIFALVNCHGRDGPPDRLALSQFFSLSLSGRAPPALV